MSIRISVMTSGASRIAAHIAEARAWLHESLAVRRGMEILAVIALSGLAMSIYLPFPRITLFSESAFIILILWRFIIRYEPITPVPRPVIILSVLFFFSCLASAVLSHNQNYEYLEYKAFRYFMIGGLLFTAPLSAKHRKIVAITLFLSASIDSIAAVLQYCGVFDVGEDRPHGFALLSTYFAAKLAFIPSVALFMLFFHRQTLFETKIEKYFLWFVILLTLVGLIVSGSRGPWVAFFLACLITLIIYYRKKAFIFSVVILAIFLIALLFNDSLKNRIVTGVSFNTTSSFGNRIELWKGSLLIFKESPLLGVGAGDYQEHIEQLVREKKLKAMPSTIHAHNLLLHTLATQGLTGFITLIVLLFALLRWGVISIRRFGGIGGYIILLCTLLLLFEGLTDYYFGMMHYFSVYYVLIGLLGPLEKNSFTPETFTDA